MTNIFKQLKEEMEAFDSAREAIIKESRGILKASKQAIYALHRGETTKAEDLIAQAKTIKETLEKTKITSPELRTGGFSNACEEYAEAALFAHYLQTGELLAFEKLGITPEEYLGGIADLTGELGRCAVVQATARKTAEVIKIKEFCDNLFGEFMQFDFRNGSLRRKYDAIKYNVQKMERVLYDLNIHGGV